MNAIGLVTPMPSTNAFVFDVFLSHNPKDKPRVRQLAKRLKAAGVRVWFDEWFIKPGDIVPKKMDEALAQSRVLLLCITRAALASGWVALERSTALHRDPSNDGRRFIPLLLGDCNFPETLQRYKYIDFRKESDAAFAEVLASCQPEILSTRRDSALATRRRKTRTVSRRAKKSRTATALAVLERILSGHKDWISSVAVTPDGKQAVSASADRLVKIWDLDTGDCRAILGGSNRGIMCVSITPDGKRVICSSHAHALRVWEPSVGQEVATLEGHTHEVWSVVALQDNVRAVSGGMDKTLKLWDLTTHACLKTIRCGTDDADEIRSVAVDQLGTRILAGHKDGRISVWELETSKAVGILSGHSTEVNSLQITPDGQFAVSGSNDRTVKVWDLAAMTQVGTLEGHQGPVTSVSLSPDGTLIASADGNYFSSAIRIWDRQSAVCLQLIESRPGSPNCVAFSLDGQRLVAGTAGGAAIYVFHLTGVRAVAAAEATRRYVNAKVVLLGEGTVGKTSLAHRLIEDRYVVEDRTHGMNVWRLNLPLADDRALDREALLWDLAGQEDYRLIHKLFLEQTALALLLINPQKDDPFREAGDWLKTLETAAKNQESKREAERLLIFAQVDVGGPKLSNAKIAQFCKQNGFTEWLLTSAKNGRNCSEKKNGNKPSKLKQLIAESILWDKLPWTSTPRLLAELKNAVMAMRDKSDIRLLRFSELAQRLEQALPGEKFGESDLRTAMTLLSNHGLARSLKFGDLVLLRPDLINGYAGAVIRAARAHTDEIGSVLEADIYGPNFDFTGVDRLKHRADEELLLRALVQTFLDHSLCIAEETAHGRHLVFPSQYRREKDIPHEPDIFVSYSFSGEWQTVWTTLVVRLWYSQEFAHRELWRNAAEFESSRRQMLGLKVAKTGDGTATISLYFDLKVPDELKVIFIEYVHRHLAKYACDVSRDRRYVCSQCGKVVKDLETVRRRLAAKKDFITCQNCDEKVPFVDFIELRLKSDPVARKILAMDETATRELDSQALEQILIGHMMAIAGEANQIFRPVAMFDYGIDGELEFKDDDGKPSGKRVYIQLKSGNSYLRTRKADGKEIFDVTNERHLAYWIRQPVDVYLVIRQTDRLSGEQVIRWMNVTQNLKARKDKKSRQIIFEGEKLDTASVWKLRDVFIPPG